MENVLFKPDSQIWVTDFTNFSTSSDLSLKPGSQDSIAHARGVDGPATNSCSIANSNCLLPSPDGTTTRGKNAIDYWRHDSFWKYFLLNTPPSTRSGRRPIHPVDISVFSDHSITTAGICTTNATWIRSVGDGVTWFYQSSNEQMPKPYQVGVVPGSTSFKTSDDFETSNTFSCGEYSSRVLAFEAGNTESGFPLERVGWVYDCCISVNETVSSSNKEGAKAPKIPAETAELAAAAIAKRGFVGDNNTQIQNYLDGTYFGEPHHGNGTTMAMMIAEFAIRVFASSGYENPMVSIIGDQPQQASTLSIRNPRLLIANLMVILGVHFLCVVASALYTYRVAIPDASPLSIANKFCQQVQPLGGKGSLLRGRQVAEALGDPSAIYTSVPADDSHYYQAVFQSKPSVPSGTYFFNGTYV